MAYCCEEKDVPEVGDIVKEVKIEWEEGGICGTADITFKSGKSVTCHLKKWH